MTRDTNAHEVNDYVEKPLTERFYQPKFTVGSFVRWLGTKVKIAAMRFDPNHREFQYLVQTGVSMSQTTWVSEKAIT